MERNTRIATGRSPAAAKPKYGRPFHRSRAQAPCPPGRNRKQKDVEADSRTYEDALGEVELYDFVPIGGNKSSQYICPAEHVALLKADDQERIPPDKVAIIYEYSQATKKHAGTFVPTKGPVSVRDLYQHRRKRASGAGSPFQTTGSSSGEEHPINQTVIFLRNVDDWTVPAILQPVLNVGALALRAFLQSFLQPGSSYKTTLPGASGGAVPFSCEFQLDYLVLRRSEKPPKPDMRWKDPRLRRSWQKLPFPDKKNAYVYGTKFGYLLAGARPNDWTAHALVDNYFAGPRSSDSFMQDAEYQKLDFATCCKLDASRPQDTWVEYTLTVQSERLGVCVKETKKLVKYLEETMKELHRMPDLLGDDAKLRVMDGRREAVSCISQLLPDIECRLHLIRDSLEPLNRVELNLLLQSIPAASVTAYDNAAQLLKDIGEHRNDLGTELRKVTRLKDGTDLFKDDFEQLSKVQANRASGVQRRGDNAAYLVAPPALAAGMLQAELMTFGPKWPMFCLLTVSFYTVLCMMNEHNRILSSLIHIWECLLQKKNQGAPVDAVDEAVDDDDDDDEEEGEGNLGPATEDRKDNREGDKTNSRFTTEDTRDNLFADAQLPLPVTTRTTGKAVLHQSQFFTLLGRLLGVLSAGSRHKQQEPAAGNLEMGRLVNSTTGLSTASASGWRGCFSRQKTEVAHGVMEV